jgi:simple sugar transport system permease protein
VELNKKTNIVKKTNVWFKDYILIEALIVAAVLFSIATPHFLSIDNIFLLLKAVSIVGLLALGLNIIVIVGGFDLSIAAIANFAAVISITYLMNNFINLTVIWITSVLVAVVLSLINSLFTIYIGIPAFITTLAMMGFATGISRSLTGGGQTTFPKILPPGFSFLGRYNVGNIIPFQIIIFIIISVFILILIEHTPFGRKCYAVGANADASKHAGIKVNRIKIFAYAIAGLLYGIAGIVMSSMFGAASSDMGENYLMSAITSVFLGATFMSIGYPNIKGTLTSVCLLAILANGFIMINLPFYLRDIMIGIILIFAIGIIKLTKK